MKGKLTYPIKWLLFLPFRIYKRRHIPYKYMSDSVVCNTGLWVRLNMRTGETEVMPNGNRAIIDTEKTFFRLYCEDMQRYAEYTIVKSKAPKFVSRYILAEYLYMPVALLVSKCRKKN